MLDLALSARPAIARRIASSAASGGTGCSSVCTLPSGASLCTLLSSKASGFLCCPCAGCESPCTWDTSGIRPCAGRPCADWFCDWFCPAEACGGSPYEAALATALANICDIASMGSKDWPRLLAISTNAAPADVSGLHECIEVGGEDNKASCEFDETLALNAAELLRTFTVVVPRRESSRMAGPEVLYVCS